MGSCHRIVKAILRRKKRRMTETELVKEKAGRDRPTTDRKEQRGRKYAQTGSQWLREMFTETEARPYQGNVLRIH